MASTHDQYAQEYENQLKNANCYIAEVLFGLSYADIRKGESILDVGIGTGISSELFYSAGLQIFGIDGSAEMLRICEKKGIARELVTHDLLVCPWPYPKARFDHVVCCGVFHFIGDLNQVFAEIARIQKAGGVFSFTVMNGSASLPDQKKYTQHIEDGFSIFTHQTGYIDQLLQENFYRKEKEISCFVGQTLFKAIVARKERA